MGRIPSLIDEYLTGDTLLKNGAAVEIFSIDVAFHGGAAAGQQIVFRNGTTVAASALLVITLNAANGTISREFFNGKRFANGCFVDFQGNAGSIDLSLTYK